jgi:Polysaccharide lyase
MCDVLRWAGLVTAALSLCGCGPGVGPTGAPEPPADDAPQPRRATPHLFDGFEADTVAAFWRAGDAGSGRFAPGAVAVSADHARTGKRSVRITVREGDVEQGGGDGASTERAELDSGTHPFAGRDLWYGFSFLVPPGFPVVETRLVVAQWKQAGVDGGPLVGQRYRSGTHHLTVRDWTTPQGARKTYPLPAIRPGRWTDMVYHLRPRADDAGLVEVWVDGVRVVSHKGPTVSRAGEDRVYSKIGLYRDRMKEPMTIYFDNYTLGDHFAAVDPSRFDRRP